LKLTVKQPNNKDDSRHHIWEQSNIFLNGILYFLGNGRVVKSPLHPLRSVYEAIMNFKPAPKFSSYTLSSTQLS